MKQKMKCPLCNKRAFDISSLTKEELKIELKCPHCHNLVVVPCNAQSALPERKNEIRSKVS